MDDEFIKINDGTSLPPGYSFKDTGWKPYTPSHIGFDSSKSDENNTCNHEYINVGFRFDKYVCKTCNKDKE